MTGIMLNETVVCRVCGGVEQGDPTPVGDEQTPSEGAVMICGDCFAITIVTVDGGRREPTMAEMDKLKEEPDLRRAVAAMVKFHKHQRERNKRS